MSPTDMLTARIFDIQRLSLHDGPGIRTNLFFKGCPLACSWCHNPESQCADTMLSFKDKLCRGCALCAEVCQRGVHRFSLVDQKVTHIVKHADCIACGRCLEVCCHDALELVGSEYSVEQLLEEIRSDVPFYAIGAGGGITFTGGEPMQQYRFISEFAGRVADIHLCMETSGYAATEAFREILPKIDLFLFDYKLTDSEAHRRFCGVDNALILQNLELLHEQGANIILRLPIIPTVNDTEEHFRGIADVLRRFPRILEAELLPYHGLAAGKAEQFGLEKSSTPFPLPTEAQKQQWLAAIKGLGIKNIRIA
ncbi:MAG: glycyl-radical enzyme activating protein [Spirochaetota bacterium]